MGRKGKTWTIFIGLLVCSIQLYAQMKMGEVLIMTKPEIKATVNQEVKQEYINGEIKPVWLPRASTHLFFADRGAGRGDGLLICDLAKVTDREALPDGSPFKTNSFTEYRLIGADKLKDLPRAGILGIHYIQVKPARGAAFEKFVTEKLHPVVSRLLPDMGLLYYKAVAGDNVGSYILIFAIESDAARSKYWPAGASGTEKLKDSFKQLTSLAEELGTYLVDDSYLKPGAAGGVAYFESLHWTDFVHQAQSK